MSLRVLHILDHSIPLHSGYTFRTLSILREQRKLGWETFHLTGARQNTDAVSQGNAEPPQVSLRPLGGPGASQGWGRSQGNAGPPQVSLHPLGGPGVSQGWGRYEEDVEGWHFYRTPPSPGWVGNLPVLRHRVDMSLLERRLATVVDTVRPDILHAHSPVLNALPALRVGRAKGIPVVYEVRAFWEDAAVDHGTTSEGSIRYRLTRAMESRALRQAAHVFTICEGLRNDIVARGIAENRVTVIPNAVDIDSFETGGVADEDLKASMGLMGATVVGFVGSFYAYEGLDLLLDCVPELVTRHSDIRVLLVGGGPQEDKLKAQAQRLGIGDKLVFAGRVPHEEVRRYYDLIDILAYPRHAMRLTELVTPLKPLEAMAQGRLLIASDVGGHKELIRHGETGWLFPAGSRQGLIESVDALLAQRHRWSNLRRTGRAFVEQERNWRSSVANYQRAYELAKIS